MAHQNAAVYHPASGKALVEEPWLGWTGKIGGSAPGSTIGHEYETPEGTYFYWLLGSHQCAGSLAWTMAKGIIS